MTQEASGNGVSPEPIQSTETQLACSASTVILLQETDLAHLESTEIPQKGKRNSMLREDKEEKTKKKPDECLAGHAER